MRSTASGISWNGWCDSPSWTSNSAPGIASATARPSAGRAPWRRAPPASTSVGRGDLRQPVDGVVDRCRRPGSRCSVLGGLLVREGQHLVDDRVDGPVVVRPRGVDVQVEVLEEGPRARGGARPASCTKRDPASGGRRPSRAQVLCRTRLRTQLGMAQRQLLADHAAARVAGHVGGRDVERVAGPRRRRPPSSRRSPGPPASASVRRRGCRRPSCGSGRPARPAGTATTRSCRRAPPISRTSGPSPTCSVQMSRSPYRMCCPISAPPARCLGPRSARRSQAPRSADAVRVCGSAPTRASTSCQKASTRRSTRPGSPGRAGAPRPPAPRTRRPVSLRRPPARARGRPTEVAAAGQHQRRRGDLRQPIGRVVLEEWAQVALQILGGLLVREGEHVVDERGDGPVLVRPRAVDVEEEPLEEGALAGGDVDQPLHEASPTSGR